MNEDLQRVVIARECGWEDVELRLYNEGTGMDAYIWTSGVLGRGGREIPDYLNDLNACVEFENILKEMGEEKCEEYLCKLDSVITGQTCWKVSEANHFLCATATAAQRAESFLRVMDLWVES